MPPWCRIFIIFIITIVVCFAPFAIAQTAIASALCSAGTTTQVADMNMPTTTVLIKPKPGDTVITNCVLYLRRSTFEAIKIGAPLGPGAEIHLDNVKLGAAKFGTTWGCSVFVSKAVSGNALINISNLVVDSQRLEGTVAVAFYAIVFMSTVGDPGIASVDQSPRLLVSGMRASVEAPNEKLNDVIAIFIYARSTFSIVSVSDSSMIYNYYTSTGGVMATVSFVHISVELLVGELDVSGVALTAGPSSAGQLSHSVAVTADLFRCELLVVARSFSFSHCALTVSDFSPAADTTTLLVKAVLVSLKNAVFSDIDFINMTDSSVVVSRVKNFDQLKIFGFYIIGTAAHANSSAMIIQNVSLTVVDVERLGSTLEAYVFRFVPEVLGSTEETLMVRSILAERCSVHLDRVGAGEMNVLVLLFQHLSVREFIVLRETSLRIMDTKARTGQIAFGGVSSVGVVTLGAAASSSSSTSPPFLTIESFTGVAERVVAESRVSAIAVLIQQLVVPSVSEMTVRNSIVSIDGLRLLDSLSSAAVAVSGVTDAISGAAFFASVVFDNNSVLFASVSGVASFDVAGAIFSPAVNFSVSGRIVIRHTHVILRGVEQRPQAMRQLLSSALLVSVRRLAVVGGGGGGRGLLQVESSSVTVEKLTKTAVGPDASLLGALDMSAVRAELELRCLGDVLLENVHVAASDVDVVADGGTYYYFATSLLRQGGFTADIGKFEVAGSVSISSCTASIRNVSALLVVQITNNLLSFAGRPSPSSSSSSSSSGAFSISKSNGTIHGVDAIVDTLKMTLITLSYALVQHIALSGPPPSLGINVSDSSATLQEINSVPSSAAPGAFVVRLYIAQLFPVHQRSFSSIVIERVTLLVEKVASRGEHRVTASALRIFTVSGGGGELLLTGGVLLRNVQVNISSMSQPHDLSADCFISGATALVTGSQGGVLVDRASVSVANVSVERGYFVSIVSLNNITSSSGGGPLDDASSFQVISSSIRLSNMHLRNAATCMASIVMPVAGEAIFGNWRRVLVQGCRVETESIMRLVSNNTNSASSFLSIYIFSLSTVVGNRAALLVSDCHVRGEGSVTSTTAPPSTPMELDCHLMFLGQRLVDVATIIVQRCSIVASRVRLLGATGVLYLRPISSDTTTIVDSVTVSVKDSVLQQKVTYCCIFNGAGIVINSSPSSTRAAAAAVLTVTNSVVSIVNVSGSPRELSIAITTSAATLNGEPAGAVVVRDCAAVLHGATLAGTRAASLVALLYLSSQVSATVSNVSVLLEEVEINSSPHWQPIGGKQQLLVNLVMGRLRGTSSVRNSSVSVVRANVVPPRHLLLVSATLALDVSGGDGGGGDASDIVLSDVQVHLHNSSSSSIFASLLDGAGTAYEWRGLRRVSVSDSHLVVGNVTATTDGVFARLFSVYSARIVSVAELSLSRCTLDLASAQAANRIHSYAFSTPGQLATSAIRRIAVTSNVVRVAAASAPFVKHICVHLGHVSSMEDGSSANRNSTGLLVSNNSVITVAESTTYDVIRRRWVRTSACLVRLFPGVKLSSLVVSDSTVSTLSPWASTSSRTSSSILLSLGNSDSILRTVVARSSVTTNGSSSASSDFVTCAVFFSSQQQQQTLPTATQQSLLAINLGNVSVDGGNGTSVLLIFSEGAHFSSDLDVRDCSVVGHDGGGGTLQHGGGTVVSFISVEDKTGSCFRSPARLFFSDNQLQLLSNRTLLDPLHLLFLRTDNFTKIASLSALPLPASSLLNIDYSGTTVLFGCNLWPVSLTRRFVVTPAINLTVGRSPAACPFLTHSVSNTLSLSGSVTDSLFDPPPPRTAPLVVSVSSTIMLAASLATAGAAARMFLGARTLVSLRAFANCPLTTLDDLEHASFDVNPLGFAIGGNETGLPRDVALATVRGTLGGNLVLLAACLFIVVVTVLSSKVWCRIEAEEDQQQGPWTAAAARVFFPGSIVPFALTFMPLGVYAVGILLSVSSSMRPELALALPFFFMWLVIPLAFIAWVVLVKAPREKLVPLPVVDHDQQQQQNLLSSPDALIDPRFTKFLDFLNKNEDFEWEQSKTLHLFSLVYDGFANVRFAFADAALQVLTGLLCGVAAGCTTDACCSVSAAGALLCSFLHIVYILVNSHRAKVFLVPRERYVGVLLSVLVFASSLLSFISTTFLSEDAAGGAALSTVVEIVSVAGLIMVIPATLIVIVPIFEEWKAAFGRWRKRLRQVRNAAKRTEREQQRREEEQEEKRRRRREREEEKKDKRINERRNNNNNNRRSATRSSSSRRRAVAADDDDNDEPLLSPAVLASVEAGERRDYLSPAYWGASSKRGGGGRSTTATLGEMARQYARIHPAAPA